MLLTSRTRPSSVNNLAGEDSRLKTEKEASMPAHWNLKSIRCPPIQFCLKALCAIALGRPNLEYIWETFRTEEGFHARRRELNDRVSNVNFVAGLLLASEAAFVSTNSPLSSVINYNLRGAYILLLVSFGVTLGGLVVGAAVGYICTCADQGWLENTLIQSRLRIFCALVILGYPFLSIGASTACLAFALLVAAWNSNDPIVKYGAAILLLLPSCMSPLFIYTQLPWLFPGRYEKLSRESTFTSQNNERDLERDGNAGHELRLENEVHSRDNLT
ncbi:hypothetical protein NM688_g3623 [Phlebia brevispora]|uniref:Uncharacterized protein n=1 Tax=Phlebia brevispora TaxID=194682 RepID=A0ACC1T5G8_9APHY|nr:hypothetical protein NM688_g3623 [Phlebia brevispora]